MNRGDQFFPPLLVIAAAIRIAVNNATSFSRADETVYLLYGKTIAAGGGYGAVIRMFVDDRGMWVLPNPLRWSYIGVAALASSSHHALATLSTIAGIAAVALTYWIGRTLFEPVVAAIATALVATSPLQLALGRRALADEFFCAAVLASVAALVKVVRAEKHRAVWLAAWVIATTIAIAAKEQFLFVYPVVLLYWWLETRKISWTWALPPALFFGVFCLLARDVTSFFRIVRIITSAMDAPYAEQFQSGPPHRLLIDSMAIAPIVTMVFIVAAWRLREHRHLVILAAGIVAVHALIPSQNLRYIVSADSLVRLVVAAFLAAELRERPKILIAVLAVNAAVELKLFYDVFITAGVYDPVTQNLLHALRMLP